MGFEQNLAAQVDRDGTVAIIHLEGVVDDATDLVEASGPLQESKLIFYCGGIRRINSVGIKIWMEYFEHFKSNNQEIIFREVSPVLVEQFNLIANFGCGGVMETLHAPFLCGSCGEDFTMLYGVDQLKEVKFEIPDVPCKSCKEPAEFDDLPDLYFRFLR